MGWVVNATPRPLYPRETDPVPIVQEAGWVPGPVWTGAESLAPHRGFDPRTVQPVASRCTDWAIAVHSYSSTAEKSWHCVWYMIISLASIRHHCALTSSTSVITTTVSVTMSVDTECLKCSKLYTLHLLFLILSNYHAIHTARSSYTIMYTGKSSSFCIFLQYPPKTQGTLLK